MAMHIISRKALRTFWEAHFEAESSLRRWYHLVKSAHWKNFADVRQDFGDVDVYKRCLVFNVGGNKYRIITAVHYNTRRIYVLHVLTHREYDTGNWKEDCEC